MRKHIEGVHEKITYPCGECQYKATQYGSLKNHIKGLDRYLIILLLIKRNGALPSLAL